MSPYNLNYTKCLSLLFLFYFSGILQAQELYIITDPASNIPKNALSLRLNTMLMPMGQNMEGMKPGETGFRISPELAYGVTKNLMVKTAVYASDMFQPAFRFEGASVYAKYRFYSRDDFHKHFRVAGFGKLALSRNPYVIERMVMHENDGSGGNVPHEQLVFNGSDEQMLAGNHSGWQVGVVATQLVNKLALSGTVSGIGRFNNTRYPILPSDVQQSLEYSFSAGYLLFPRQYDSYGQTNLNLYVEWMGQQAFGKPTGFLDMAPAIQLIFNSKSRIDLGYRFQVGGNMRRFNEQQWLLRFEYNWLQAFK